MAGANGFEHRGLRKLRAHVAAQRSQMGEVGQKVDLGDHSAADANAAGGLQDRLAELGEDTFFNLDRPLVRGQHADLVLLQLRGGEALRVGQGLLALVVRRHQRQVGARDLDRIAEDIVKANL